MSKRHTSRERHLINNSRVRRGLRPCLAGLETLAYPAICKGGSANMTRLNLQTHKLPENLVSPFKASLQDWSVNDKLRRLWARDASLWTGTDEANWLGWLGIVEEELTNRWRLIKLAEEIKNAGFSDVLLLGMGGSSLCPEVMKMTFGKLEAFPELHVLDSTDPSQIKTFESRVDLTQTIFIVSSKSGSTLEPNIFKQY